MHFHFRGNPDPLITSGLIGLVGGAAAAYFSSFISPLCTLGGTVAGAAGGAFVGLPFMPPIGPLVGGVGGGIVGYYVSSTFCTLGLFLGEVFTAYASHQYLTGKPIMPFS